LVIEKAEVSWQIEYLKFILPFLKGVPEGGGIYETPFFKGSTRRGRDL
jgi:hypothetical protein